MSHVNDIIIKFVNVYNCLNTKPFAIMKDIIKIDSVEKYNALFGVETLHPLVSVVSLAEAKTQPMGRTVFNYGLYALFLKNLMCGDILYGRQTYDYQEGTVTSFAPGQVVETTFAEGMKLDALGLLFHPDLIKGTSLGQNIRRYSFFSYSSNEALHLSDEEKGIYTDCLEKIKMEISRPADKHSRRLISRNIELLLDYCMRFYERQFITRSQSNKSVIVKFENLLDDYFREQRNVTDGLPTVKYFADKVFLSPNYFGDMIKKETGITAQEYIKSRLIGHAKELILGTEKTVNQISMELGFQYPQHFNRIFKKATGLTPSEYRKTTV